MSEAAWGAAGAAVAAFVAGARELWSGRRGADKTTVETAGLVVTMLRKELERSEQKCQERIDQAVASAVADVELRLVRIEDAATADAEACDGRIEALEAEVVRLGGNPAIVSARRRAHRHQE